MEDSKRWALQINRKELVKDLRVEEIQDHMMFSGIMDEDDFEKISNSGKSRKERASAFLDHITKRGPAAFDHCCEALHDNKQQYLSKKLRDDAVMLAKRVGRGARMEVDAVALQLILRKNDSLDKANLELQHLQQQNEELQRKNDRLSDRLSRERKKSAELAEEGQTMKKKDGENVKNMSTLFQVVNERKKYADQVEQDVRDLEEQLYQKDENLNIKEETIKRLQEGNRKAEGDLIQERRMVKNFKGQLESYKKDLQLMKQDLLRVRGERIAARKQADAQGQKVKQLQHELMISRQLKNNCESVIKHLNGSVESKEQQAHADLSRLLQQYLDLKQTVS
ncbi:uncharacterized protein [Amphiura filiformis]|uniref:uncharacterized protein n=1 Tax=Amphiura filiformis TaxID=82378 RepID=UPI003B2118EE